MQSNNEYHQLTPEEVEVESLGECTIQSPFTDAVFKTHHQKILYHPFVNHTNQLIQAPISFTLAAPSPKIYFDPQKVKVGIVTCGGICPGLNDVIRAIVMGMNYNYGVHNILGLQYGLQGFIPEYQHSTIELTTKLVSNIHDDGGTILGTSRGDQDIKKIVDSIERMNLNIMFFIGGDGTLQATNKIYQEIKQRHLKISVIGIPKTIDNDISNVGHSFGFDTAVEIATRVIRSAHVEAIAVPYGIGLVKLMGRHSGFIAATAAAAQRDANFVLIPELDFKLQGKNGFLPALKNRLQQRQHAVVVVAEGAGQKFFQTQEKKYDASGNLILNDIGTFLKKEIADYFINEKLPVNIRYIDPSYLIRSVPANTSDGLFCADLAQNAVHAAMAGKTGMLISLWNGAYCSIPIPLAISKRKQVSLHGRLWQTVLEATGQQSFGFKSTN